MDEQPESIVHLCQQQAWELAQAAGEYRPKSLEEVGFIHCSRPEQILEVANNFFPGQHGLVVLWIDHQRVQPEIRWEPSDGDVYPHIYGPLNLEAVRAVQDFTPDIDGFFRRMPGGSLITRMGPWEFP